MICLTRGPKGEITIDRILLIITLVAWISPNAQAQLLNVRRPPLLEKPAGAGLRAPGVSSTSGSIAQLLAAGSDTKKLEITTLKGPFPWHVAEMKLLAPGVGWVATAHGLFWTQDDGKHWKNITPRKDIEALGKPFFLDTRRGWTLSVGCSTGDPKKLELGISLFTTSDSGATWSSVDVHPPSIGDYGNSDGAEVYGCSGEFAFVDSQHGWLNVTVRGVTMNSLWAFLLTTTDAGRTWRQALTAPSLPDGQMLLLTPSDGWLAAGPRDEGLFATHDGTKTWERVSVIRPSEVSKEAPAAHYALPTFQDSTHGFLPVTYYGGVGVESTTVLFKTGDTGRTWKPDRILAEQYGSREYGTGAIVGSAWMFVAQRDRQLMLKTVREGERVESRSSSSQILREKDVRAVSFLTPSQVWVVIADGDLLSTTDGGATWTDITPDMQRTNVGTVTRADAVQEVEQVEENADRAKIRRDVPAAEAVVAQHKEILKIPHVVDMEPTVAWDTDNRYVRTDIVVYVDYKKNLEKVKRKVPTTLQGFPLVVEPVPVGHYL